MGLINRTLPDKSAKPGTDKSVSSTTAILVGAGVIAGALAVVAVATHMILGTKTPETTPSDVVAQPAPMLAAIPVVDNATSGGREPNTDPQVDILISSTNQAKHMTDKLRRAEELPVAERSRLTPKQSTIDDVRAGKIIIQ